MPTYTLWAPTDTITVGVRQQIARAITEIHHEVGVAPRYFVQVVFADLTPGSVFIAGHPAEPGHVWVRADIRAGRTDDQKRRLLGRLTGELGGILGVDPEEIWVYINDIPGGNIAEYGRPLPDPGQEDQWFAALPGDLRARLDPLR